VKLDFVIDEGLLITDGLVKGLDKPAALIGLAEKGYATLVLHAEATPGHSSMPPRDTAIGMMAAALARLEDHRLPLQIRGTVAEMFDTLAPEMSGLNRVALSNLWLFKPLLLREFAKTGPTEATVRTTTALTIFNAGDKDNVLPGHAEATVNFRLIPGDTQASVTEQVAATDSRHYVGVTDKIFRFSPVRATGEDLKRFHGTNERLSIEGYADMIRFYRRLLENAAG
jgi:carboxypeptidase PM20D1